MKIKPIAAQQRQQHWGFTTAGFVLEPGTMLNSTAPILHSRTLCALINKYVIMLLWKLFFGPLWALCLFFVIMAWRSSNVNYDINSWNLPESTTCPQGSSGRAGGELSVVRSRQVTAEWPNCLSCCLSGTANLPSPSSPLRSTDSLACTGLTLPSDPDTDLFLSCSWVQ